MILLFRNPVSPSESKGEGGPFSLTAFDADRSAMSLHNLLNDGKAKPCSCFCSLFRDTEELLKDPWEILTGNTPDRYLR